MNGLTRREAMVATGGLVASAALPEAIAAAERAKQKPNILFILADDLGYADLSCYGRTDYETPNIDRLAREGMQFMQAYSNSAVCTATRVGLITGRYQDRLPIGLEEPLNRRPVGLPVDHPTIASRLRAAGYATALIGKWHLGILPDYDPMRSGYDEFWGLRGGGVDYYSHSILGMDDLWDGPTKIKQNGYLTDLLADHAVAKFDDYAKGSKPFFMSLHFTAPHWPWEAPGDLKESERYSATRTRPEIFHVDGGSMKTYAAMVQRLDFQVGRLMRELKRLKLDRNTIVVFTSDNGGERFSKTWPFSGKKTQLLEGGIRVPAIIRWPGVVRPASKSEAQFMSMDYMPTFLAAAGGSADPAYPLDGIDIMPALLGRAMPERALFWRYKNSAQAACRLGDWKYLKVKDKSYLFNLADDPMERANFKARDRARFEELVARWNTWNSEMLPFGDADSHVLTPDEVPDHFAGE